MPANNKKKPKWYCYTSEDNLRKVLRNVVLATLDIHRTKLSDFPISDATMKFLEEDILGFVNREARCVRFDKDFHKGKDVWYNK